MTVSKWETGVVTPTVSTLLAVAELYGVPVEQLCDDDSLPVGA
jgi:transcriptional regulator with XRE-family HTH domain